MAAPCGFIFFALLDHGECLSVREHSELWRHLPRGVQPHIVPIVVVVVIVNYNSARSRNDDVTGMFCACDLLETFVGVHSVASARMLIATFSHICLQPSVDVVGDANGATSTVFACSVGVLSAIGASFF